MGSVLNWCVCVCMCVCVCVSVLPSEQVNRCNYNICGSNAITDHCIVAFSNNMANARN